MAVVALIVLGSGVEIERTTFLGMAVMRHDWPEPRREEASSAGRRSRQV